MHTIDKHIRDIITRHIAEGHYAGAQLFIAQDNETVLNISAGHADIETCRPIRDDSLFCIASMSKAITACSVMLLADAAQVDLDQAVHHYVPEFHPSRCLLVQRNEQGKLDTRFPQTAMTLRHCLAHCSGLARGDYIKSLKLSEAEQHHLRNKTLLQFDPGSAWEYGGSLDIVARVIEAVSGLEFPDFLQARLLGPLGMRDTCFYPTQEQQERLVFPYAFQDKHFERRPFHLFNAEIPNATSDQASPSHGLFSTCADVWRFLRMVSNGGVYGKTRLLSVRSVNEMLSLQSGDHLVDGTNACGWSLGWCLAREHDNLLDAPVGSFGHAGIFGTWMWHDPATKLSVIFLAQRSPPDKALSKAILRDILSCAQDLLQTA